MMHILNGYLREIVSADFDYHRLVSDPQGMEIYADTTNGVIAGVSRAYWKGRAIFDAKRTAQWNHLQSALSRVRDSWEVSLELSNFKLHDFDEELASRFRGNLPRGDTSLDWLKEFHQEIATPLLTFGGNSFDLPFRRLDALFRQTLEPKHTWVELRSNHLPLLEKLEDAYCIVDIVKRIGQPFPLRVLYKLALGDALNSMELGVWNAFSEKLLDACTGSSISINELHRCMRAIISRMPIDTDVFGMAEWARRLGRLYWRLQQKMTERNCHLFDVRDAGWEEFVDRSVACVGSKLKINGREVQLGQEYRGTKPLCEDNHRVFAQADDPTCVVVVNRRHLVMGFLEPEAGKAQDYGLPQAELVEVGWEFGFTRFRMLSPDSVASYAWEQDQERTRFVARRDSFIARMKEFCDNNYTPVGLDSSLIRFGWDNSVRFARFMPKGIFDFDKVVEIILDCVRGRLDLYREIARRCGLDVRPEAEQYTRILNLALQEDPRELNCVLEQIRTSQDPRRHVILQKSEMLQLQVQELLNESKRLIRQSYNIDGLERDILLALKLRIGAVQRDLGPITYRLLVKAEEITNEAVRVVSPPLREECLTNQVALLQSNFDTLALEGGMSLDRVRTLCLDHGVVNPDQIRAAQSAMFAYLTHRLLGNTPQITAAPPPVLRLTQ